MIYVDERREVLEPVARRKKGRARGQFQMTLSWQQCVSVPQVSGCPFDNFLGSNESPV